MFKLMSGYIVVALVVVLACFGVADLAEAKSRVSSKPSSFSSSRSYSAPKVVSRPAPTVTRTVTKQTPVYRSTPTYRSAPRNTTVIQKNYYSSPSRGYGGGSYGNGGGYNAGGGGAGVGTAIVGGAAGAVGGMLLMDALTEDEGEKALKLQQEQIKIEEAKAQQERDDKQDQILENQEELQEAVVPEPSDSFFKVNPNLLPAQ